MSNNNNENINTKKISKMENLENKLFNENENGARYYSPSENVYVITYLDSIYSNEFEAYLKERYIVTPYEYGIKVTK